MQVPTSTKQELLTRDVIEHIVAYLPLTIHELLKWEQINKEFFSVADQQWFLLWRKENPSTKLEKNYRFACMQTHVVKRRNPLYYINATVAITGPKGSGKSALVQRFDSDTFGNYDPTCPNTSEKQIKIQNIMYQVNVLEVHQEEEYKGLTVPVYRIASCVILCCDLSDGKSLDELANFVELIRNIRQDCYTPMIISVNKSDLGLTGHPLSLEQVEMFAAMHNIGQVITTSALDNTNVKKAFEQVVVVLSDPVTMNPDWIKKLENGISILDQPKKKKKCAVM